jgi:hypothetical protein
MSCAVEAGKQYRTRAGREVEVIRITRGFSYAVVGIVAGDSHYSFWDLYGKTWSSAHCDDDLVLREEK